MSPRSRDLIESSLLKKGFKVEEARDHRFYYFYYNGKKTICRTKISTGSSYKEYSDSLLKKIKKQLMLTKRRQLDDLIDCPMTKDDYVDILKDNKVIG